MMGTVMVNEAPVVEVMVTVTLYGAPPLPVATDGAVKYVVPVTTEGGGAGEKPMPAVSW